MELEQYLVVQHMIKEILILQKNIILEIIKVVFLIKKNEILNEAYTGNGKIINSDFLNNLDIDEAKEKIINEIEKKKIEKKKHYID